MSISLTALNIPVGAQGAITPHSRAVFCLHSYNAPGCVLLRSSVALADGGEVLLHLGRGKNAESVARALPHDTNLE